MSKMNRVNDESMEEVVGGKKVVVKNKNSSYSNIRMTPGLQSSVTFKVTNGTPLITTGEKDYCDGIVWYKIKFGIGGDTGWIAGSCIGL